MGKDGTMKIQNNCRIGCGHIYFAVLLAALQTEDWADSQGKQWIVCWDQIPENAARYKINLRYEPSKSAFYRASQRNIKSVALAEEEQIDKYEQRISFDTAVDGCQYSILMRPANEVVLLNRDGMQILMARLLRSRQYSEAEILQEGCLFLGHQLKIPFELAGRQVGVPTTDVVPGTFYINIHGHTPYSYQGSFSTTIRGSVSGSTLIDGTSLELSLSHKESSQPKDWRVNLTVRVIGEEAPIDSAGGKIADVLTLQSAKLVVEKMSSDNSEIVLATLDGDVSKAKEGWLKSRLSIGKTLPAFARVDLTRRRLLTLEELRKEAWLKQHIVFIFGELKRQPSEYGYRGRVISELMLDEAVILRTLQKGLKYSPVVVFVCRRLYLPDLYEKWLGQDVEFYVISDYSNPMDVQFWISSRHYPPSYDSPHNITETLRGQFTLPEDKVSVLVTNDRGNLEYIKVDAGQELAEALAEINKLIHSKR